MKAIDILALTMSAVGCEDPAGPTISDVAGAYEAVEFTTTTDGSVIDHLADGAQFEITLDVDGITSGTLFIPGAAEGGGDFSEDLFGSWMLAGDTVRFDQEADTFIRDMPFEYRGGRLAGDATFGDVRVRVTLARSD